MRKIIVSLNTTLDGFISGPHCELDWHFNRWTSKMAQALGKQLSYADTILLGRITYCAMAKFWSVKSGDVSLPREDIAFAEMMNRHSKIVFSKTLETPCWNNSRIVRGDFQKEVTYLKNLPGKDMIVYGSGTLVSALMQWNLVDEYTLWIHPVFLGKGKPLCRGLDKAIGLEIFNTEVFSSGVVKMDLLPEKNFRFIDQTGQLRQRVL